MNSANARVINRYPWSHGSRHFSIRCAYVRGNNVGDPAVAAETIRQNDLSSNRRTRKVRKERREMSSYRLDPMVFDGYCGMPPFPAVRLADSRNFIAPPWPREFWTYPTFTRDDASLRIELAAATAKNMAAAAAIDNLKMVVDGTSAAAEAKLDPLEQRIRETAEALFDLERAAAAAEEADAAAVPISKIGSGTAETDSSARDSDTIADADATREVQITKNDPKLRYDTNLPVDMLGMVYAARQASGSLGVHLGTWYRTLQDTLVADRPAAARKIDSQNGRTSRTFVAAVVLSLQSAGRTYVGSRHYTAFESAVLCAYAFSASYGGIATSKPPGSFAEAIANLPNYLEELAESISSAPGRARYFFESQALSKTAFAAPGGGRYEKDALLGHSVLMALMSTRALPLFPGTIPKEGPAIDVDESGTSYDDRVNRAAAALLGRAQPLFLMEDQTALRGAIDCLTALLLLRRLTWNTNVYADRTLNAMQLGAIIPGAPQAAIGASAATPKDAIRSDGRNFDFLVKNYIYPLYVNDKTIEITQMFPGFVAICLEAAFGGLVSQGRGTRRRVVDVSSAKSQSSLLKLVALELENRNKTNVVSVREVIEAHDALTLQFERGMGAAMQSSRPREAFVESGKASAFNVLGDYDLLYFLCLGYIPRYTSSI